MAKMKSKYKGKGDGLVKAFHTLELFDDGTEYEKAPQMSDRSRRPLREYTIEFAQFCHQPLKNVFLDFIVTAGKIPEFLFVRVPHKIVDKVIELNDEDPEEIIPGLPSGHHRFIRFRTSQRYGML